jgi:lipid-binding SYLF domain-containing protein
MKLITAHFAVAGLLLATAGCMCFHSEDHALKVTQAGLTRDGTATLQALYAQVPLAKQLQPKVKAILVFPNVYKAGFLFGGHSGNGVALTADGRAVDYLNITSASYGLQLGAQKFSYALFLMSDVAIEHIKKTGGWEIGMGPTVVFVDKGAARTTTTTTLNKDVYAFIFNQQGLMAGLGLQGSKITRINPEP